MPRNDAATFKVEDAQLIFRNFKGEEGPMNRAGSRNFCVILDQKMADKLAKDNWNVRVLQPQEEGEEGTPYIPIEVSFKNYPPRVVMITSSGRTYLTDDTVEVLDWTDIETVDLIARAYNWKVGEKSGVKAYLQSMYVTIAEDDLDRKYALPPDERD